MAFLHNHSCECIKSELDLFALPSTQTSVVSGQWVHYKPLASLNSGPLEFLISGNGNEYIDLSQTMLHVAARIKKTNGDNIVELDKVSPINNFLHSLFSQVDVCLNQRLVTPANSSYGFRAYIETLLNYGSDAKNSHLSSCCWYADTPKHFNSTGAVNAGYTVRSGLAKGSKTINMVGRIHADIFNQEKFMLNGVEMRVKLVKARDSFSLIGEGDCNYTVEIVDASLLVRRAKISPTILLAHAKALELSTAKYAITRTDIKVATIPSGTQGKTIDNLILGQLPKRCIIGFVKNNAFNGDFNANPFNFEHNNLSFLSLYVDNVQIPSKPLQPDFSNENYVHAYNTLFTGTGINFLNEGNSISMDAYPHGNCLYAFDLTPTLSASNSNFWNLVKHGSVRVEVKFSQMLTETLNCLIYAEFDNVLEIDKNRNVIVDYGC